MKKPRTMADHLAQLSTTGGRRTKPRTPLHVMTAEWKTADPSRRRSIQAHWHRSEMAFIKAVLADAPEGIVRPTEMVRMANKWADELLAWNSPPFGARNPYGMTKAPPRPGTRRS